MRRLHVQYIHITSLFLSSYSYSFHSCRFNGFCALGRLALHDARQRAEVELDSMALVVCYAMRVEAHCAFPRFSCLCSLFPDIYNRLEPHDIRQL